MIRSSTQRMMMAALLAAVALLAGCVSVSRDYAVKRHYLLQAERPETVAAPAGAPVLRVQQFRAAPQFAGRGLVCRTGEASYRADFYNEFLVAPDRLITQQTRRWMASSGMFGAVVQTASAMEADYALEGTVTMLYADLRDAGAPFAVLGLELLLVEAPLSSPRIASRETYEFAAPLDGASPDDLVDGWNRALRQALEQAEASFRERLAHSPQ